MSIMPEIAKVKIVTISILSGPPKITDECDNTLLPPDDFAQSE